MRCGLGISVIGVCSMFLVVNDDVMNMMYIGNVMMIMLRISMMWVRKFRNGWCLIMVWLFFF